jgi:glycosyltransferase involved in cell wall biosynthesis
VPVPGVSGFSIVRNAVRYGYPVLESLRSLLPLVEELVVAVGNSDDGTPELVRSLGDPRLVVLDTVWDDSQRAGGRELARQTNLALQRCRHPWAFYLQADEVLHEDDYPRIAAALERHGAAAVDALSFRFIHFEGTYDYVNVVRYRKQCRLVRNDGRLASAGDAAGFARTDGRKLSVRRSGARVFHYGWARAPEAMRRKLVAFQKLYSPDDRAIERRWRDVADEHLTDVDIAFRFRGTHPAVMRERVAAAGWTIPRELRPPLDTPLLNPRFYAAWLRKWRVLPRR